jgi:phosphoribosylglycinamide formyltransferase-1
MAISLAIFASGTGSNAQKIIEYFKNHPAVHVSLVVSNNSRAGVLGIAQNAGIETLILDKQRFRNGDGYAGLLKQKGIGFIVLAGFLWKVPDTLLDAYPGKIVNIHPALLPKYGGKGMYGKFVHEAVLAAGEKESGITIHYVDNVYDHGRIIFQESCTVDPGDDPDSLAMKVHQLEHLHFAPVLEKILLSLADAKQDLK